jgi:uncharacterized protein (TIGR00251 family)
MAGVPEARLAVRLQPRAARDGLVGVRDGVLVARVSAPPLDGRANRALCRLVAEQAGVPPTNVTVIRGERSRDKVLRIVGVDGDSLAAALSRP